MSQDAVQPPRGRDRPGGAPSATLYDLLQVSPWADRVVVEAAYQALVRADQDGPSDGVLVSDRRRKLYLAYATLSDPRRRAAYDEGLRREGLLQGQSAASAERVRTICWRCNAGVDAFVPYCSVCHWLICQACHACGCQQPDWRARRQPRRPRWLGQLAWGAAVVAVSVGLAVTLGRPGGPSPAPDGQPEQLPAGPAGGSPTLGLPILLPTSTAGPAVQARLEPGPAASPRLGPNARHGVVAAAGAVAELRQAPRLQAALVAVLPDGAPIVLLGPAVDEGQRVWRLIQAPDGQQGWVEAALVQPAER